MEITIKADNGMEIAGMFSGMFGGGPSFSLPENTQEEEMGEQNNELGERVRELRGAMRMSQEEFSKTYNIPKRTIGNWETGERKPPEYVIRFLERIVEADKKLKESEERRQQDIVDVATGKKKVRFYGKGGR